MSAGIFGSSFNPPHIGHMALVRAAKEHFGLDRIILVPTHTPPHKAITNGWLPEERLVMTHLAALDLDPREMHKRLLQVLPETLRGREARADEITELYDALRAHVHDKNLQVSEIEWENKREKSFTIDTLEEFSWRFPDEHFTLLIGRDQAVAFDTWKEPEGIQKLAKVAVADRGGEGLSDALGRFPFMESFPMPRLDISSTELRARSAAKKTLSPYVTPCVERFVDVVRARKL